MWREQNSIISQRDQIVWLHFTRQLIWLCVGTQSSTLDTHCLPFGLGELCVLLFTRVHPVVIRAARLTSPRSARRVDASMMRVLTPRDGIATDTRYKRELFPNCALRPAACLVHSAFPIRKHVSIFFAKQISHGSITRSANVEAMRDVNCSIKLFIATRAAIVSLTKLRFYCTYVSWFPRRTLRVIFFQLL